MTHKILLADDSVSIRKVVELTFAEEGFAVTTVGDGDAAMQKFVEIQPDIVLVDVNMPGPSGYQICEMIKQDESTNHIPVVLLVGSFEPFDQEEAERVGADGFLTKPFQSIRELVGKVDELLGNDGPPPQIVHDTADIDSLYVNSLVETIRIDNDQTDEYLGDAGLDDEMIEASYPSETEDAESAVFVPGLETVEPGDGVDPRADTLEMDTIEDIGPDGSAGGFETLEPENGFERQVEIADPAASDEMEMEVSARGFEIIEPIGAYERQLDAYDPEAGDQTGPDEFIQSYNTGGPIDPFEGPAEAVETAPDTSVGEPAFEPRFVFDEPEPMTRVEDVQEDYTEPAERRGFDEAAETPAPEGYSPELVNLITRKVIDHLSDKVIREIAQEAVPRIAEKLIREALDDEKKS